MRVVHRGSIQAQLGTQRFLHQAALSISLAHLFSMDPVLVCKLAETRDRYRAELATALVEDADPLAAYDSFVKWTLESYGAHLAQSGLLELLEEATRRFADDATYKTDLRYLKLWLLYASHVEDPTVVYAFALSKDIGRVYAQTYWEYAGALERKGK